MQQTTTVECGFPKLATKEVDNKNTSKNSEIFSPVKQFLQKQKSHLLQHIKKNSRKKIQLLIVTQWLQKSKIKL